MKSFRDAHLLGGEYLVVEDWYSWVIFTSENKPCANLGMQKQSVQMTSHCPCLMFTWRRNAGLEGADLCKSEISDRLLFSLGVQESSKHGIACKKWNGTQLAWYELQIFGHMRSDLRKIFTRVCVTRWPFCFTHLEHDDVIKWKYFPRYWPVVLSPRSFHVFFDLRLNERFSKQSWDWWLEKPLRPLWRHMNGHASFLVQSARSK